MKKKVIIALTIPRINAHGFPCLRIPKNKPTKVMTRNMANSGIRIASFIKNPSPIANTRDIMAGAPIQHKTEKREPTNPNLSICLFQKFFIVIYSFEILLHSKIIC